jgi:hypothetical protein
MAKTRTYINKTPGMSSAAVVTTTSQVKTYAVGRKGGGRRVRDYVDALYSTTDKPLCAIMKAETGHDNADCSLSTAYTTWKHTVRQNQLYGANGKRQKLHITYDTSVTLPHWEHIHAASTRDAAEARRADILTALHEAGHRNTPVALSTAMTRFAAAMPATVDARAVPDYNAAVQTMLLNFYTAMSRQADSLYDLSGGHGFTQGAVYTDGAMPDVDSPSTARESADIPWIS